MVEEEKLGAHVLEEQVNGMFAGLVQGKSRSHVVEMLREVPSLMIVNLEGSHARQRRHPVQGWRVPEVVHRSSVTAT